MRSVFVVLNSPAACQFSYLLQISEQVEVEQLVSQASIEAFDKGIPVRFPRFNVIKEDAIRLAPADEHFTQELWAIVGTEYVRQPSLFLQLLKNTHQAG